MEREVNQLVAALLIGAVIILAVMTIWLSEIERGCERENNVYDCQIIAVPSPQVTD